MATSRVRYTDCPACGTPCAEDAVCSTCRRAPAKDRLGTTLAGRYRLDRVIGRGGFGVVYEATQLALDQVVAVKFLLAEWARVAEARVRFEREARALVRLHHPGIVAAYDFGEDEGDLYLVMEWVPGVDLASELRVDGKLMAPERIVRVLDQVLAVLELAHEQGLVHRDLKPENVMLLDEDRVKVLDFGLVLVTDAGGKRLTASNAVQGTCYYMAPEQCRGRDVGPKADVYAVGIMLFELLAGEPPFIADTAVEVMMQQLMLEPPRVRDRAGSDPHPGLEALARKCLAKNPEARPTASELRKELAAVLRGEDAVTRVANDVQTRVAAQVLSRNERAIGHAPDELGGTAVQGQPLSIRPGDHPRVVLSGFVRADADRVRSALAMQGVTGDTHAANIADARALILQFDEKAAARVTELRASAPRLPILVASARADATASLIRAGASDVTLAGTGDDVLTQKVWRLIRRKR